MSEQYAGDTFKDGQKFYWQADTANSEYVIFVGANLIDANYGPSNRNPRTLPQITDGKLKVTVLDPRFTKMAAKAKRWVPVKPGTDAAFAMGMTRWILENKRFDAKFLANANKAAAATDKESTWTNSAWLVKLDDKGTPGAFLRAHEIGLKAKETRKDKDGKEFNFEYLVAMVNGQPVAFDPNDEKEAVKGELFVTTELKDKEGKPIKVKSGLQVMLETAKEKSIAEYAEICGTDAATIEAVAKEFTSYGKKACVDMHRGPAQHTNGFYNISSLMNLNLLIGNFDWTGGMIVASTWNTDGTKTDKQPFSFKKITPKAGKPFGLSIIRHDAKFEESTLFTGKESYPAKRNWWPLSSDVYEEILPSCIDAYPYATKALFSYMGAPTYSLPAGQTNIAALADLEKLPLYFASDILVGPTSMYADYIFPDLHLSGALGIPRLSPQHAGQGPAGTPTGDRLTERDRHGLRRSSSRSPTRRSGWPWRKNSGSPVSALTASATARPSPGRTTSTSAWLPTWPPTARSRLPTRLPAEIELFLKSRRHLPKNVFDPQRWEAISGAAWPKVVTVLNRGGRFATQEESLQGGAGCQQVRQTDQSLPGEDLQVQRCLHRQALLRHGPLHADRRHPGQGADRVPEPDTICR